MTPVTAVRYDLAVAGLRRRTAAFLDRHPAPPGRFVAVVAGPGDRLADVGRTVERAAGGERPGADVAAEYAPWEADSRFIVVLDRERSLPAGAARVIDAGRHGTKALHDVPPVIGRTESEIRAAHRLDDGGALREMGAAVVLPRYRGKRSALQVSTLLYRAFVKLGAEDGVRHVVAVLDRPAYRNATAVGSPFVTLAGSAPFEHRGSAATYALYGDLTRFTAAFSAQAARLRRSARPGGAEIRSDQLRKYAIRRVAADIAARLASGDGLDDRILTA